MDIVEDAFSLLVKMNALEKPLSSRGRYEPTFYGRLLDSLPLSFDASMLALKFGQVGILREGILISILMEVQPPPIYHPFGNQNLVRELVAYRISVIFFLLTIFLYLLFQSM